MLDSLVELARGEALEVGALPPGDVDDLDIFAGTHDIGLSRRVVDADVLQRDRPAALAGGFRSRGRMRLRNTWRRIGVAVSCAPASIAHAGRSHDQQAVARDGEFGCVPGAGVAAEQRDGAGAGEIDATPLKPGRTERALSPSR